VKIEVVGLGYVGYALAVLARSKGFEVIGVDKDERVLAKIRKGTYQIEDRFIASVQERGQIDCTSRPCKADVFIVCVPTPVTGGEIPDLQSLVESVHDISRVLADGNTVVIESTIYPGVCREIVKPILDKAGRKYQLAHCPERVNPGDDRWNVQNIPRVLGGIDHASTIAASAFYRSIIDAEILPLSQIEAAEATKILENTFRDINIAFINEMAKSFYRLRIDISEVIRGASTKPFGFLAHYPGAGVGGHCIAIDPYYMIAKGRSVGFDHEFLKLARRINRTMPAYVFSLVQEALNEREISVRGTRIAVLGISYKPNVIDDRESPSYDLIEILKKWGAILTIYDPYHPDKSNAKDLEDALSKVTCAVIATAHDEFRKNMDAYRSVQVLVDGRNCLDKRYFSQRGALYKGVGIFE
jgi:UDP-N-acetyl-D-glucosamine dehydrogenase